MKRIFLLLILTAATLPWATAALAQQDPSEAPATRPVNPVSAPQKLIFVPDSLKPYDFNKDDERWCWRHSAQTQNIVYFWEKPFGDNPQNPPSLEGKPMKFDLGNLQTQVERFYHFFRDTLKFSLPGSICDQYKMMVMVNYSLKGTAYGGTYDDFIGALWRVNPDWLTDEKFHFNAFRQLIHKGYLHLDNIYHSPYVIEWWAEKHGLESIAQLYREGKVGEDPVVTYKRKYKMSQKQFNDEMFDCYRHLVNFDFDYARKETRPYACTFDTKMMKQKNGYLRPDTASVPENYGFNAIKLEIPKAGKKVTVDFRALDAEGKAFKASKDKMARTIGYRYGLVGVTADTDECIYSPMGEAMNGKVSLVAPKSQPLKALYLVVMGAPSNHSLDPSSRRFPYEVRFY